MIWLLVAIGVYFLALLAVSWISLHPFRTPHFISPGSLGAPQEELELDSGKGVHVHAWWVQAAGSKTVAVLAHGYVMNRSELTPLSVWLWRRGVSSLLVEFRAHGHSRVGASTAGIHEARDVAAAVEKARQIVPGARVVLIGSSMGAAAAAFAAADGAAADALVLDSCYSRLLDASLGWWRFLGGPVLSWVLAPSVFLAAAIGKVNPLRADVGRALAKVDVPVLLLHGRCDNLARPTQAERNNAACKGPNRLIWFDGCGHSEFRWEQPERYYAALESFLSEQNLIDSACTRDVARA